jgi:hypothetical protein
MPGACSIPATYATEVPVDGCACLSLTNETLAWSPLAASMLERRWPELWAQRRQPAPSAAPSVTIAAVQQIAANVIALDAPVDPLRLVERLAQAFGLARGSSGTLAQALAVPALNEPAPVLRGPE